MKILFLCFAPVHKMHFTDMYITDLGRQFDYEIWDISMLGGGEDKVNDEYPDIPRIHSRTEFSDRIAAVRKSDPKIIVISNILIYNLHLIYDVLHKEGIPVIQIDKESIIYWMRDQYLLQHPDEIPDKEKSKYFWTSNPLTRKVYRYLEYQHVKFDYMLGARNYFPESSRQFVHIHNLKYDEYLNSTKAEPVLPYKYILFMDAGLAHLPSVSGKENSIDRADYLKHMNKLFKKIEDQCGLPVVIAAHPKSEYPSDPFEGRQVILYKTAPLAQYAELVLVHYSTAIVDLVLQRKPIVFMYSKDYMQSASRTILITTIEYAKLLNAPLIDIRGEYEIAGSVDEKAYDLFIKDNIINFKEKDKMNAELISNFIKSIVD